MNQKYTVSVCQRLCLKPLLKWTISFEFSTTCRTGQDFDLITAFDLIWANCTNHSLLNFANFQHCPFPSHSFQLLQEAKDDSVENMKVYTLCCVDWATMQHAHERWIMKHCKGVVLTLLYLFLFCIYSSFVFIPLFLVS